MGTRVAWFLALAAIAPACSGETDEPVPYGGEVLIEHVRLPDGSDVRRLSAFFVAEQDPEVPDEIPLGSCREGVTSIPDPDTRRYDTVGDSVTFHLGDADYVVPQLVADPDEDACVAGTACAEGVVDFYGRRHDIAYLREVSELVGDGFLMAEHSVSASDAGLAPEPMQVLQPPVMEVTAPATTSADAFDVIPGQDVEFAWHQDEPADDLTVNILLGDGVTAVTCRSADTGSFTAPASVFDGFAGDQGSAVVYSVSRATAVTRTGRAIDVRAEYHGNSFLWQKSTSSP